MLYRSENMFVCMNTCTNLTTNVLLKLQMYLYTYARTYLCIVFSSSLLLSPSFEWTAQFPRIRSRSLLFELPTPVLQEHRGP